MTWKSLDRALQVPQGEVLPYHLTHEASCRQDADLWPGSQVCLRLRAEAGVLLEGEVVVHTADLLERVPLERVHTDQAQEVWQAVFMPTILPFDYYFRLETVTGRAYLGDTGLQASLPFPVRFHFLPQAPLDAPTWARGATFYQIFPDRFHRVGEAEDGLHPWDAAPTVDGFKGGNLAGITARLDHLRDLGIEAIYLNPIFLSPSTHRYDTLDFFQIDPRLGTLDDLRELVSGAHALGMKVILDGVFNHVSEHHPFFQDVLARGPESPYWTWFELQRWPLEERPGDEAYSMWWGHAHLPELRVESAEVQAYLLSIATHWIEAADIDGWRLDVAGELPLSFWQELRRAVRRLKPECYLLGEYWGDARRFVQGDSFDATMNYPFRRSILGFLSGAWDASALARDLSRLYYALPRAAAECQYNLLGSHDVPRLSTLLGGRLSLVKLAFALQAAYPGVSALYYGDELGLPGEDDPDCRRAYPWETAHAEHDLFGFVRGLYRKRRESEVLRGGDFRCVAEGPHQLLIERRLQDQVVSLRVNRQEESVEWQGEGQGAAQDTAPQDTAIFEGGLK